jgi:hypothetical protein
LGALSRVPFGVGDTDGAELRLSWRVPAEPELTCRIRTADELARLPAHMREEEVCERRALPYRLRLTVNDSTLDDRLLGGQSARTERRLDVHERFTLPPGRHAVRLEFAREGGSGVATPREHDRATEGPTHALPRPAPVRLTLDTALTFLNGEVLVVTYDDHTGRLVVIARGALPPQ